MSKKYGTSHHNFGPYPDENADAIHEGLRRLSTAASKAGFECFITTVGHRFVRAAFPHHSTAESLRFDRFLDAFGGAY
jgi:hypothetical protein